MVEGEWGEGKGLKYKDCDGDWLKMKNNDDVVEVWNQTKSGVVTLKVFSQKNQVNFVVLLYFVLFYFVLFFFGFVFALLFTFFFFFFFFFFLVIIFIIVAHDQLFFLDSNFFHHTDSISWCLFCHLIFSGGCFSFFSSYSSFSFFFFLFLSFSISFFFFFCSLIL